MTGTIPTWWTVAMSFHSAPLGIRRIMLALAHLRWSAGYVDDEVACMAPHLVGRVDLSQRMVELGLVVISSPAGADVPNGNRTWTGLNFARRRLLHGRVYAYQLNHWHAWHWTDQSVMPRVQEAIARTNCDDTPVGRGAAVAAASGMWQIHREHVDEPLILRQPHDPTWVRWVGCMTRILDRGYTLRDVQNALRQIRADEHYRHRMGQCDADILFEEYFPAFLQRHRVKKQNEGARL